VPLGVVKELIFIPEAKSKDYSTTLCSFSESHTPGSPLRNRRSKKYKGSLSHLPIHHNDQIEDNVKVGGIVLNSGRGIMEQRH